MATAEVVVASPLVAQPVQQEITLTIAVPKGAPPGSLIQTTAPDGRTIQVTVPAGATEGSQVQVTVPQINPSFAATAVVTQPQQQQSQSPYGASKHLALAFRALVFLCVFAYSVACSVVCLCLTKRVFTDKLQLIRGSDTHKARLGVARDIRLGDEEYIPRLSKHPGSGCKVTGGEPFHLCARAI